MAITGQRIVVRLGMSEQTPGMPIAEMGWDVDLKRLRVGDGSPFPTIIMSNKSLGPYEYNFIQYVQFPEIRMLPEGTVDGVDISDLNRENGFVVRRGDNLWAHRELTNTDGYVKITYGNGVDGNPIINFSDEFKVEIGEFLKTVAVDDVTIHGDGRVINPLHAHIADYTAKGVVELATGAETITGVDPTRAITPESLSQRTATFTRTGLIRVATLAEVNAGVSTDTAVCPAYLRNYVASNSKQFGAILKTGVIYSFPPLQNSGSFSVAGYTCCVVVVSGGGDAVDGTGGARLRVGNVTMEPANGFNGDNPIMDAFGAGSTGNYSAASQYAMFKSNGTWYITYNGVAFIVGSGDTISWGKDQGTGGSIVAGTPVGF